MGLLICWPRNAKKTKSETDKVECPKRAQRLHLYGLVQGLSYVVRLNDFKTAQHLRAKLAWVLRRRHDPPPTEVVRLEVCL
jgi:hypothetical protein